MPYYHPNYKDKRDAIEWARHVMRLKDRHVILDTETTGLGNRDEIIQLAVIDLYGKTLFNENMRPTTKKTISKDASVIHGLTMEVLANCPIFRDFEKSLEKAIGRKNIITYNAKYDMRMYKQTYKQAGGFLPSGEWICAMLEYAKFVGEWNDYYGNYKWQKLEGGDHTALGDCLVTLELIRSMAIATKSKKWFEFWIGR
jgi:DNA polymerase-3 subunit epsilon